jgi:hypothetical protein
VPPCMDIDVVMVRNALARLERAPS